jgi:hypothetical protein
MNEGALFVPDGDRFVPTELTRGGWSDHAQHGGPPVGLVAHVIKQRHSSDDMMVTRLTTDLIRPVPLTPLTVESRVVRPGKRIQVIEAILRSDDLEVALATALLIRIAEVDLPERPDSGWEQPRGPEHATLVDTADWTGFMAPMPRFHVDGVETRTLDDSFLTAGLGTSWFRLRHPVVAGVATSPFVRAATLADFGNGNSTAINPREWLYVNPDVDLSLHRPLDGEWLGMRSFAHQHNTGIGLAQSTIFDAGGPIGTVTQSQLIEPHRPS